MKKYLLAALINFIVMADLFACPYCIGGSQSGKDANTTLILSLFILSIYVPYFFIFRLIKKHRALKEENDNTGPADS